MPGTLDAGSGAGVKVERLYLVRPLVQALVPLLQITASAGVPRLHTRGFWS